MHECSICKWQTAEDNHHGKKRHEEWHSKAWSQKRNTAQGTVKWVQV